jgi:hypothetical protein
VRCASSSANVFTEMAAEEGDHSRRLIALYQEKLGEHIPLIRRQDIRGPRIWWASPSRPSSANCPDVSVSILLPNGAG